MSTIQVYNHSSNKICVSINKWGDGGSTDPFTIEKNSSESWGRSNKNGFLMIVDQGASEKTYFVRSESIIKVYDDTVTNAILINFTTN